MRTETAVVAEPDSGRRAELVARLIEDESFETVVGCANFLQAVQSGSIQSPPSLLIINVDSAEMLDLGTWAVLRTYLGRRTLILALSSGEDRRALEIALGVGVAALHHPNVDQGTLRRCINRVRQGHTDFDPGLAQKAKQILMGPQDEDTQIRVGGLNLDLKTRAVSRWGKAIHVSPLEFDLLVYLARNRGRIVSPSELLEAVWGTSACEGGTLDQVKGCVKRLRRKIEPIAHNPRHLRSVKGRGYALRDPLVNDEPSQGS